MRKILDKMFQNKKLSFFLPLAIAVLIYSLFALFGTAEDKSNLLITVPIGCVFWFFGVFLIVFIQVKNSMCPEWFLNLFELLAVVIFSASSFIRTISFIISGFQNFDSGLCLGMVTFSAVSWAHSKRIK